MLCEIHYAKYFYFSKCYAKFIMQRILNGSIWDWIPTHDDSILFKNLVKLRNLLMRKYASIQNSLELLFSWQSNWSLSSTRVYKWLRIPRLSKPWIRFIWRSYIPPKYAFTLWLGLRNRLSTNKLIKVGFYLHNLHFLQWAWGNYGTLFL